MTVHQIGTTSLANVAKSRKRKAEAADAMFGAMMDHMASAQKSRKIFTDTEAVNLPEWMRG